MQGSRLLYVHFYCATNDCDLQFGLCCPDLEDPVHGIVDVCSVDDGAIASDSLQGSLIHHICQLSPCTTTTTISIYTNIVGECTKQRN